MRDQTENRLCRFCPDPPDRLQQISAPIRFHQFSRIGIALRLDFSGCRLRIFFLNYIRFFHFTPSAIHRRRYRRRRLKLRFRDFSRLDQIVNGKPFRFVVQQFFLEILLFGNVQGKIEFAAGTCHVKCLTRHLFRRHDHVFRGHALRDMRGHHPAVFDSPETLRKLNRGQFPPIGIQQEIFIRTLRRNRQTPVVDFILRMPDIDRETDDIALPDGKRNRAADINAVFE